MIKIVTYPESPEITAYLKAIEKDLLPYQILLSSNHTLEGDDEREIFLHDYLAQKSNFKNIEGEYLIAVPLSKINSEDRLFLNGLSREDEQFLGILDLDQSPEFSLPLFRNLFQGPGQRDPNFLSALEKDLKKVMADTFFELQRVKKFHEKMVPLRSDKIKGIKLLSKYGAGTNSGGEFYDIIKGDNSFGLLLTSGESYLLSSLVLNHFDYLRKDKTISDESVRTFFSNLGDDVFNAPGLGENRGGLQAFFIKVDLKQLKATGYHFGNTGLVSPGEIFLPGNDYPVSKEFLDKAQFSLKLQRGEKMAILSPGLRKNCQDQINDEHVISFVKKQFNTGPRQLINEVFFQLKKDSDKKFLNYDASLIYLEVDINVIVQI